MTRGSFGSQVFRTKDRGYGIKARTDLPRGTFIGVYLGEVLSYEESEQRELVYEAAGAEDFYSMALSGVVVDATRKGGRVRFTNHSCAANCVTQMWTVRGRCVPALFTVCNVPGGTELTLDYAYDSQSGSKAPQRCRCGAPRCRGFIQSGSGGTGTDIIFSRGPYVRVWVTVLRPPLATLG